MSTAVIKGLALAVRSDHQTCHLRAFLSHHLQVCEIAYVLVDHRPGQPLDDVLDLLREFGDRVVPVLHPHENFNNGATCTALSSAVAKHPQYDVIMHVDKDEFFRNLGAVEGVVERIRSGESDYAEGQMVCRFAPGGYSYSDDFPTFDDFCKAAPVRADIIRAYRFPSVKCCLNRAPAILIHQGRHGWTKDPTRFSLEHFRWIDGGKAKTDVKVVQHSADLAGRIQWRDRMVRERTENFLTKLEDCFRPLSWDIEGWMDYEDLFRQIAKALPKCATFVELGVWKGRSLS